MGTRYEAAERVGLASRLYLLVSDVDVDLMLYRKKGEAARYGLGFATNVRPHIELHGEIDYRVDERSPFVRDGELLSRERSGPTYLLGLRYLTSGGTTLIGEYYHRRAGMSQDEVEACLDYVRDGVAADAAATRAALSSHARVPIEVTGKVPAATTATHRMRLTLLGPLPIMSSCLPYTLKRERAVCCTRRDSGSSSVSSASPSWPAPCPSWSAASCSTGPFSTRPTIASGWI